MALICVIAVAYNFVKDYIFYDIEPADQLTIGVAIIAITHIIFIADSILNKVVF